MISRIYRISRNKLDSILHRQTDRQVYRPRIVFKKRKGVIVEIVICVYPV